ncbi:tRNA-dihydrouridine synthase [Staphylococcus saprophyticus]|jgi:tRNA-dihydrouridine synthase|uniref:tRNA-dihydrouridine synthase n=1 Tax=Staphylococcus saprophyticus subsp. saprophyticus (strain ATCC 15305 / DSM 20229 / NCIMB 8711 / NCTC 7292 / S-41) TaxID=342451 RepID=Q4A0T2_STAS1|nr:MULTISPECIES: tRNA-dihydrouridine synthase [Staphylococcus]CRV26239.1 tRNA-dihydrouridine synthase [Streptococcus equi subsp. equi]SIN54713.1 putative TIM-barrel protein, nifR3 family [Mycobacteroides abscessus subsp. abscessus]AMG19287.1 tRNA-dihydrouridine synthase [Staphylococcus saprophyticus]AMG32402.1 tRNA-dihydrouridine synthase [Staphylococcus saprophyticus]ASE58325.1 tRNA-dihydrouridine synthase [Staphylococcus saprophyticus]
MKENFWRELPRPFFVLAPMEDVTDVVFRHVVSEAGRPDVFFTEFTNTESYCHPEGVHSVRGRLTFTEDEQPIVAHIWGDKPDHFREMSIGMAEMGFKGIDLNMGCPVPNVATKGKGSGLIQRPEIAAEIIQAAKAGGIPVSVKTRLGYSEIDEWRDWLRHVFEQDIANLSIHLRTRREMSKVDAHWELIGEIKKLRDEIAPDTLLTINGDIPDRKTGLELAEKYGIDGVMIGRGIFHNPYAFEKEPREHTSEELLGLLRLHLDLFDQYTENEPRQFKPLRRFFKIYVRGIRGASELRHQLMSTNTTDDARKLLDEFEAQTEQVK